MGQNLVFYLDCARWAILTARWAIMTARLSDMHGRIFCTCRIPALTPGEKRRCRYIAVCSSVLQSTCTIDSYLHLVTWSHKAYTLPSAGRPQNPDKSSPREKLSLIAPQNFSIIAVLHVWNNQCACYWAVFKLCLAYVQSEWLLIHVAWSVNWRVTMEFPVSSR